MTTPTDNDLLAAATALQTAVARVAQLQDKRTTAQAAADQAIAAVARLDDQIAMATTAWRDARDALKATTQAWT